MSNCNQHSLDRALPARSCDGFAVTVNCVEQNLVKAGLVDTAEKWLWVLLGDDGS